MGLWSFITGRKLILKLEMSLGLLMTVPGNVMQALSVLGTFTEGSVKISPSFKGYFMRFALHCWDIKVFVLAAGFQ